MNSPLYGYCLMRFLDPVNFNPWGVEKLKEAVQLGYITNAEYLQILTYKNEESEISDS
ncbi:XkdX family protein [Bacillus sp. Marseille-P3800]|uniref:XkdX family protein n=1 Tax=Bacillus sp. Marseille-P3800 TaxID=2014782 RepID=UPI00159BE4CE|nr:XkdX family protein [Bacillus sp. Marseille-P3800]